MWRVVGTDDIHGEYSFWTEHVEDAYGAVRRHSSNFEPNVPDFDSREEAEAAADRLHEKYND